MSSNGAAHQRSLLSSIQHSPRRNRCPSIISPNISSRIRSCLASSDPAETARHPHSPHLNREARIGRCYRSPSCHADSSARRKRTQPLCRPRRTASISKPARRQLSTRKQLPCNRPSVHHVDDVMAISGNCSLIKTEIWPKVSGTRPALRTPPRPDSPMDSRASAGPSP